MNRRPLDFILPLAAVVLFAGADWLHFRGTDNRSVSGETNLPKSLADGRNVAWKVPLPGRGPSSPIVVAGQVVVTCSSGANQDRLHLVSFDAQTGERRWHRQLWATGHTVSNPFGAVANNTPASDGRLIFAMYSSNDLACFDLEGNLKWFRGLAYDYPAVRNDVGMASSPLVVGDTLIVQLESQGESFIAGLDTATGQTRWRRDRQLEAIWSSPTVLRGETPDQDIVLTQTRGRLTAHEPHTGRLLWDFEAPCHTVASVTTAGDTIYLPAEGLLALEYDRPAETVTPLWHAIALRSGNSSPIVHEGRAYVVKSPGILVCGDVADGSVIWQLRLTGPIWATPVLADGHLYLVNHDGLVQVVRLGEEGELVATSQIDPGILASPAVAGGAIYFRSDEHLWKVALPPGSVARRASRERAPAAATCLASSSRPRM